MDFRPGNHSGNNTTSAVHSPATHKSSRGPNFLKDPKQLILWLVVFILLIAAIGTAAYYIKRYNDTQKQLKKVSSTSQQTAQAQNQQLIDKIGKLTPLPTGETPTVATVTDITKLKDQPFFANAINNDKVLIYTQAKKAYLYRPSTNKLINIAPVNIGSDQTSGTSSTPTKSTTSPTKKTP
jgi:type II secretory pathway pseudopilin PulG